MRPLLLTSPFEGGIRLRNLKRIMFFLAPTVFILALCLVSLEIFLRSQGFGNPPLYTSDPSVGYFIKPSQSMYRFHGCRVFINSSGMRSNETTRRKPPGKFRVLVLGDSVPYGGSYIDQDELFCSVAQRELNRGQKSYEILNGGVNAYGPQNVANYLANFGHYDADMVIIYLPWSDLYRDFTTFHTVPFWSNSPRWALAEFFRHGVWRVFGILSRKWKSGNAREDVVEMNLKAMAHVKAYCEGNGIPVYFFWSPGLRVAQGRSPDDSKEGKMRLRELFPEAIIVDMEPILRKGGELNTLFVDDCHYSRDGHRVIGHFLAKFIKSFKDSK